MSAGAQIILIISISVNLFLFLRIMTVYVKESKYLALLHAYKTLDRQNDELIDRWNRLVRLINSKGGLQALKNLDTFAIQSANQSQFTRDDINRLITLCHPDKHGGKQTAVEMTQRLLAIRNR